MGGTERAAQQELQKYTGEMNVPHLYTFNKKLNIKK
jgi:hypothetical protein